eukprot:1143200-Pelagomonas_calceolata.AAC.2
MEAAPQRQARGVMERIAFKVYTREGCVCRGVIILNSLDMALDMLKVKLWGLARCGKRREGLLVLDDVLRNMLLVVFHQRASGMCPAKSVSQVGLFSFRWILAAVFQTAMICRFQEHPILAQGCAGYAGPDGLRCVCIHMQKYQRGLSEAQNQPVFACSLHKCAPTGDFQPWLLVDFCNTKVSKFPVRTHMPN